MMLFHLALSHLISGRMNEVKEFRKVYGHCSVPTTYEANQKLAAAWVKCQRRRYKLRLEGKEYIVKDGDVIHFRFNV